MLEGSRAVKTPAGFSQQEATSAQISEDLAPNSVILRGPGPGLFKDINKQKACV